jgi:hypothetical protein
MMRLPGGLVEDGRRGREWAFRPVSGALELAVAEVGETAGSTPQAVTQALSLALDHLAGGPASRDRVAALCVADRQFLMRELEQHLGSEGGWFEANCTNCGERFDFEVQYAALPVHEAEGGFPEARVDLDGTRLTFRLPTGADQEELVRQPETDHRTWLLNRLLTDGELPGEPGDTVVAAAENALEAVAPGIVLTVLANCPACRNPSQVELDPYRAINRSSGRLLREVHQLATHYHWSEADILGLPHGRRQRYLRLIDRSRGMTD